MKYIIVSILMLASLLLSPTGNPCLGGDNYCCTKGGCGIECCVDENCPNPKGCMWGEGFAYCLCGNLEISIDCRP